MWEQEDKLCSEILQELKKNKKPRVCKITGRKLEESHMSNEEWDYFKKCQYAARYFLISSEYFSKLKRDK